jgi:Zn-dependent protease
MYYIQQILLFAIPLIFAITVHEVAHGFVALQFGDKTAKILGRLTLNPIKHIDPLGTIIVPCVLYFTTGFVFGWAKPVPINPRNFSHKRLGAALVSAAGPFANLIMAFIWGLILKIAYSMPASNFGYAILQMSQIGILFNIILLVLNLLPLPPLDGSRIVSSILPGKIAYYYDKLEPYGFIILLILLVTGVLSKIILPMVFYVQKFIVSIYL